MGGLSKVLGKSLAPMNDALWGSEDPLNLYSNEAADKAKAANDARKLKLDNPEDDTQETTRVLQL